MHLWRYESQADREARRTAMAADPAWGDYLRVSEDAGLLVVQENRILKPTDFSSRKLRTALVTPGSCTTQATARPFMGSGVATDFRPLCSQDLDPAGATSAATIP